MRSTVGVACVIVVGGLLGFGSSASAQEAPTGGVLVHVRSGTTGAPLPGIELSVEADGEQTSKAQSTAEAVLRLRRPSKSRSLRFFDDELAGWLDLGPETTETTLYLLPPRALAIQVVDTAGETVTGVPVSLIDGQRQRSTSPPIIGACVQRSGWRA